MWNFPYTSSLVKSFYFEGYVPTPVLIERTKLILKTRRLLQNVFLNALRSLKYYRRFQRVHSTKLHAYFIALFPTSKFQNLNDVFLNLLPTFLSPIIVLYIMRVYVKKVTTFCDYSSAGGLGTK